MLKQYRAYDKASCGIALKPMQGQGRVLGNKAAGVFQSLVAAGLDEQPRSRS